MSLSKKLGIVGLTACLSACGGGGVQDFVDVVNAIPSVIPPPTTTGTGGTGSGTGGTTGPDYARNGFTATQNNSFAVVTVVEKDNNSGVTRNLRFSSPEELRAVYDPARNTLTIISRGRAFDGTSDAESVSLTSSDNVNFGATPNSARVVTGRWTYAMDGRYDQDDGRFRHNLAVAGGQRFTPPTSGAAIYRGNALGTVEQFDASSSITVPFVAPGNTTVNFGTRFVTTLYDFDPSRSNGRTGRITGTGTLSSDGTFSLTNAIGSVNIGGTTYFTNGTTNGFVAGPNAQEAAGIFGFTGSANGKQTSMTGAFIGADANR